MHFNKVPKELIELHGEYSISIVALSIVIACVASYTAVYMNERSRVNSFLHRNVWLGLASIAMGFGIWSMHFIGMLAFSLPISMQYDRVLTIISVFPAMFSSFLTFYMANRPNKSIWLNVFAAIVMGIGISTMHYLGMAAMIMEASYVYDLWLFIVSIAIAIATSFVALFIFSSLQQYKQKYFIKPLTAIVMGLAVSSMHYTGMMAITYYVRPDHSYTPELNHEMKMFFIIISVTVGMFLLLVLLFLSGLFDRYMKYRTYYYDSLTNLPNRRQFERRFVNSLSQKTLAVWHIHNLEKINRENGYLFGDEVIRRISTLLIAVNPTMTDLYRIEGNRFAFLMKGSGGENDFLDNMKKISEILSEPLVFENQKFVVQAVCAWSKDGEKGESEDTYTNVLAVLNHPSTLYKHEVIQYDSAVHNYTFEMGILNDVTRAMANDELYLVYQPKINGRSYEVTGVETLLRWQHPTYGMLSPAVFIPILEESNHMLDVTDWIIERTCRQISEWSKEDISFGQVAINIPGPYVASPRLLRVLKEQLIIYKLEPQILELEITETSFMKTIEESVQAVSKLRQEGFSVALDDFGTGVSSLSYLKRIPISTLKIDKSFVDGVPKSEKDSSIIQAIITLGRSLDLSIVFEGVETEEQVRFLVTTCEKPIIQGFYFAKPMISKELLAWNQAFNTANTIKSNNLF